MSESTGVHVLLNQKSGSAHGKTQEIKNLFKRAGVEAHILTLTPGSDACALARKAIAESSGVIVAAGGDGTVSAVASAVAGTNSVMGILPVGTLNHFAKDLRLPLDLPYAVQIIAGGHHRKVDAAEVNGRLFVNNSSIGLYPNLVSERERLQHRGLSKWISLAIASGKTLARFRQLSVTILVNGKEEIRRTPFVFVGNNKYIVTGPRLGSRERLDSGHLYVYFAPRLTRFGMVRLSVAALFGRLRDFGEWETLCVEEFSIASERRRVKVSYDGEVTRLQSPLHYRSRPAALNVAWPSDGEPAIS